MKTLNETIREGDVKRRNMEEERDGLQEQVTQLKASLSSVKLSSAASPQPTSPQQHLLQGSSSRAARCPVGAAVQQQGKMPPTKVISQPLLSKALLNGLSSANLSSPAPPQPTSPQSDLPARARPC